MGCKVDSLIERHSLTVPDPGYESVDEYLVARWTGADGRSADGYKALTDWFNERLLKRLYKKHGRDTMSVHLDREYEAITGDDGVQRDELAADLATDGLEIDGIADEMVSWSTMRHHLKGCLGAEKDTPPAETDWETDTVRMARDRAAEKTRSVLSSLTSKGRLPEAERADVDVQVKLSCPECSVRVPFEDAIERGYVCETHTGAKAEAEAEPDEPTGERDRKRDRARTQLSGIAIPYGIAELLQTVLFEEPFLADAAMSAL